MRKITKKLLISTTSLLVVFGGLEIGLRMAGKGPKPNYYRWQAHPDLQVVPLPNQDTFFGHDDRLLPVRINAYSQRGENYPLKKPAGERRIVILGDSLTFGQGVRDQDCFPAQLQTLFGAPGVDGAPRIINAGINGWSTWHYMRWAETQMKTYDPDVLVVALFLGNDMMIGSQGAQAIPVPLENVLRNSVLYYELTKFYRSTIWKRVEATKSGTTIEEIDKRLDRYRGIAESDLSDEDQQALWELNSIKHLEAILRECKAANVEPVCLMIPSYGLLDKPNAPEPPVHVYLRNRLEQLGFRVILCRDELMAGRRAAWLKHDIGHLSISGNAIVAGILQAALK